jgi:hypothetical protein
MRDGGFSASICRLNRHQCRLALLLGTKLFGHWLSVLGRLSQTTLQLSPLPCPITTFGHLHAMNRSRQTDWKKKPECQRIRRQNAHTSRVRATLNQVRNTAGTPVAMQEAKMSRLDANVVTTPARLRYRRKRSLVARTSNKEESDNRSHENSSRFTGRNRCGSRR